MTRLLLVAGGAGGAISFTAPPPPAPIELTAAPTGGWTWFGDPRALHYNGYVYFGYVKGTNGDVEVRTYRESTGITSSAVTLHAALEIDDHASPAFMVRDSDHRLMAFYSRHYDTTMRMRISTNSLDTDPTMTGGFAAEVSLDSQIGAVEYLYANPIQLTGEANDPIYLFFRELTATELRLGYSKSTDDGATWGSMVRLLTSIRPKTGYWKMERNGDARIDFFVTNDAPLWGTGDASMFHLYMEGGLVYKSDGTQITATQPFLASEGTVVHDATGTGPTVPSAWMMDASVDPLTGHPVVAYVKYPTTTDHRYMYGRWTGSAWDCHEIVAGGPSIATGTAWPYSGGMAIDRLDASKVYASVPVSGNNEMWEYVTADGGATWSGTALTTASSGEQVRPAAIRTPGDMRVLWMTGAYDFEDDFNVGTRGTG